MSRKFLKYACCVVVALQLVAVALVFWERTANPVVERKSLQDWIDGFEMWQWPPNKVAGDILEQNLAKTERLLQPMLLYRDSGWRLRLRQWLASHHLAKPDTRTAGDAQSHALAVCLWLGPKAGSMAPAVARLVTDYPVSVKNKAMAEYALSTLVELGTNGVDALAGMLTNANAGFRTEAAHLLGPAPQADRPRIIAALARCTNQPDPGLRRAATLSLQLIEQRRQRPNLVEASPEPARDSSPPRIPSNLWSERNGLRLVAASALHIRNEWTDLFGTSRSGPEPGHLVFAGGQGDGSLHFLEWETTEPISLQAFGLLAFHDSANNHFLHAFREFRLFVWRAAAQEYVPVWIEPVCIPYGQAFYQCCLGSFRNLPEVCVGSRFRLEIVQAGPGKSGGPRLLELYGFDHPITQAEASQAIREQEQAVVVNLTPRVLHLATGHGTAPPP